MVRGAMSPGKARGLSAGGRMCRGRGQEVAAGGEVEPGPLCGRARTHGRWKVCDFCLSCLAGTARQVAASIGLGICWEGGTQDRLS